MRKREGQRQTLDVLVHMLLLMVPPWFVSYYIPEWWASRHTPVPPRRSITSALCLDGMVPCLALLRVVGFLPPAFPRL